LFSTDLAAAAKSPSAGSLWCLPSHSAPTASACEMAHEHTTPQRSLEAAYAAEQRAQAGIESRLRKDTCYGLYEASLKCRLAHALLLSRPAAATINSTDRPAHTPVTLATGWRVNSSCRVCFPLACTGLDQNDYNRDACEEAFDAFKACRANQKASKAGVRASADR
jgi:hypothetical protein